MRPRAIVVLWRSVLAASVALAALCAPISSAAAQLQPVTVGLHGIFGDQAFLPDGYGTVVVELENRTRRTLRGTAGVLVGQPYGRGSRPRHAVRVDLPPPAPRRVLFTVFAGANGRPRRIVRSTDASLPSRASRRTTGGSRSLVLWPIRRASAAAPTWIDPSTGAVERCTTVRSARRGDDRPRTVDPLLPEEAVGYATVACSSRRRRPRVPAPQRSALEDRLGAVRSCCRSGRRSARRADPWLIGDVSRASATIRDAARCRALGRALLLACGEGPRRDSAARGRSASGVSSCPPTTRTRSQRRRAETRGSCARFRRAVIRRERPLLRFGAQEEQQTEATYTARTTTA